MDFFDAKFLFASLIWGSIGVGYFIYGRKQQAIMPLMGGILMIAVSYLVSSALWMSLICIGLIVGVYFMMSRGF